MKAVRILAGIGTALGLACATTPQDPADSIYFGANVITMDERDSRARAVAFRRGRVLEVAVATGLSARQFAHAGPLLGLFDLGALELQLVILQAAHGGDGELGRPQ